MTKGEGTSGLISPLPASALREDTHAASTEFRTPRTPRRAAFGPPPVAGGGAGALAYADIVHPRRTFQEEILRSSPLRQGKAGIGAAQGMPELDLEGRSEGGEQILPEHGLRRFHSADEHEGPTDESNTTSPDGAGSPGFGEAAGFPITLGEGMTVRTITLEHGQKASVIVENGRISRIITSSGQVAELKWKGGPSPDKPAKPPVRIRLRGSPSSSRASPDGSPLHVPSAVSRAAASLTKQRRRESARSHTLANVPASPSLSSESDTGEQPLWRSRSVEQEVSTPRRRTLNVEQRQEYSVSPGAPPHPTPPKGRDMPTILEANAGPSLRIPTPVGVPALIYQQPEEALGVRGPSLPDVATLCRAASTPKDGRTPRGSRTSRQNFPPPAQSPLAPRARDRPLLVNPEVGTPPRSRRGTAENPHFSSPSRHQEHDPASIRGPLGNPRMSSPSHRLQDSPTAMRRPADNPFVSSPTHYRFHHDPTHTRETVETLAAPAAVTLTPPRPETLAAPAGATLSLAPRGQEGASPQRGEREMVTPRAPGAGWAADTLSPMLRSHAVELTPGGDASEVWTSSVHASPGQALGLPAEGQTSNLETDYSLYSANSTIFTPTSSPLQPPPSLAMRDGHDFITRGDAQRVAALDAATSEGAVRRHKRTATLRQLFEAGTGPAGVATAADAGRGSPPPDQPGSPSVRRRILELSAASSWQNAHSNPFSHLRPPAAGGPEALRRATAPASRSPERGRPGADAGVRASPTAPAGPGEAGVWLEAFGRQAVAQGPGVDGGRHALGGASAPGAQEEAAWPQLQAAQERALWRPAAPPITKPWAIDPRERAIPASLGASLGEIGPAAPAAAQARHAALPAQLPRTARPPAAASPQTPGAAAIAAGLSQYSPSPGLAESVHSSTQSTFGDAASALESAARPTSFHRGPGSDELAPRPSRHPQTAPVMRDSPENPTTAHAVPAPIFPPPATRVGPGAGSLGPGGDAGGQDPAPQHHAQAGLVASPAASATAPPPPLHTRAALASGRGASLDAAEVEAAFERLTRGVGELAETAEISTPPAAEGLRSPSRISLDSTVRLAMAVAELHSSEAEEGPPSVRGDASPGEDVRGGYAQSHDGGVSPSEASESVAGDIPGGSAGKKKEGFLKRIRRALKPGGKSGNVPAIATPSRSPSLSTGGASAAMTSLSPASIRTQTPRATPPPLSPAAIAQRGTDGTPRTSRSSPRLSLDSRMHTGHTPAKETGYATLLPREYTPVEGNTPQRQIRAPVASPALGHRGTPGLPPRPDSRPDASHDMQPTSPGRYTSKESPQAPYTGPYGSPPRGAGALPQISSAPLSAPTHERDPGDETASHDSTEVSRRGHMARPITPSRGYEPAVVLGTRDSSAAATRSTTSSSETGARHSLASFAFTDEENAAWARVWERHVERVTPPLPRPQLDSARLSRTLNAEEIDAIVRSEAEGDESYIVDEPSLQESMGDRDSVGPHRSSGGMQGYEESPGTSVGDAAAREHELDRERESSGGRRRGRRRDMSFVSHISVPPPLSTGMAGRWRKSVNEGSNGSAVDELLDMSTLQRLARQRIVEMEVVETANVFEIVWHIPLNANTSKITKSDRYMKDGTVVESLRRDGRPGPLRSQLTFTSDGTPHIRSVQGEPYAAAFHDRIRMSSGGHRLKLEQKFTLLASTAAPVKHHSIWHRVE